MNKDKSQKPFRLNHDDFVDYVKENSLAIFGENLDLYDRQILQTTWEAINPDLIGTDAQGKTVIVEVKTEFDDADSTKRRDAIHKSVGQLLNYAAALSGGTENLKKFRLFIISDTISHPLLAICVLLEAQGINIQHQSAYEDI